MEHSPMIAQLNERKIKMITKEKQPLKNLLQKVSSNDDQLMSSGAGTLSLFMNNFVPL